MKIKYELIQNTIIYTLSIVFILFLILVINKFMFPYYDYANSQLTLVDRGINIIDTSGAQLGKDDIDQYRSYIDRVKYVHKIESYIVSIYIISGLMVLILSITNKIKLIETNLQTSISKLENLESIELNNEYSEINTINANINQAIIKIQAKDQARVELHENMVHDIMTPIHILKGNVELVNSGIDINLQVINEQISRLENLAKLNVLTQEHPNKRITGNNIIEYIELLKLINSSVNITSHISEEIEFITKTEYLYRIIDNIIDNAIKHGKPDNITISLIDHQHYIELSIANDGIPIANHDLEKLFERSYSQSGSGFGLDIVQSLIQHLDYQIAVSSNAQKTEFTVQIPKTGNSLQQIN